MRVRVIPSRTAFVAIGAIAATLLIALIAGAAFLASARIAVASLLVLVAIAGVDYVLTLRAWERASPRLTRTLPAAFAVGVKRDVALALTATSGAAGALRLDLHDHADASVVTRGLPLRVSLPGDRRLQTAYAATPTRRGVIAFAPADVRVRSRWGWCELLESLGAPEVRRVYPDFAQVARYAWLATDRRLQQIGVKTYQQRGQGTDFKQLSEYRIGDPIRHLDWRATLRLDKPIVRQFQDERDQCVMLLVDCGRRMRADDRHADHDATHFDHVLNAAMLMTYVALRQGDAVGAMTFGTPAGEERSIAPRKGLDNLNSIMGSLYDVQPTATHSDYLAAARGLLRHHRKRSLVIIITNFRDEDASELGHAVRLLQSRHLVMLASIRERVVRELMMQPLATGDAALDVASAHLYEQARRDAFQRLVTRHSLMVDAEPERLGVDLVNRYRALKRAGTI